MLHTRKSTKNTNCSVVAKICFWSAYIFNKKLLFFKNLNPNQELFGVFYKQKLFFDAILKMFLIEKRGTMLFVLLVWLISTIMVNIDYINDVHESAWGPQLKAKFKKINVFVRMCWIGLKNICYKLKNR